MNGIVINIDPVILRIGHFGIGWYSVAIIVAVIAAAFVAAREAKRKGVPPQEVYNVLPWILIAGLIGARLLHVVDRWDYYSSNPLQIIQLQQGGLAIWGGVFGGGIAAIILARIKGVPIGRAADIAAPALLTAQIIGRFGCIVNGDAYGGITGLPWGFIYVHPDSAIPTSLRGVPTHPYPVYEMLWNLAVLLLIIRLRHRFARDGLLFLSYLSLYSIGRLALTFVRQENTMFWGLQQAQVLAIAVLIVSATAFVYLLWKARPDTTSEIAT